MTSAIEQTDADAEAVAIKPRVTLQDIKNMIEERYDLTLYDMIGGVVSDHTAKRLKSVSVCTLVLKNGFIVIGKSAPAYPENYNAKLGQEFAFEDAIRQAWPLFAFSMLDRVWRLSLAPLDTIS